MTSTPGIDTLDIFTKLKNAGVDEATAEVLAHTIKEAIAEAAASRTDLASIETRLESMVIASLAKMQVDAANTRAEFHKLTIKTIQGEYRQLSQIIIVGGALWASFVFLEDIFAMVKDIAGVG